MDRDQHRDLIDALLCLTQQTTHNSFLPAAPLDSADSRLPAAEVPARFSLKDRLLERALVKLLQASA